ncbi:MAG TPA: tetratricopeptide repeat protein [Gemmatimonadota bacterium]|nr:tetratricopeptide repeat protein [Gemmatimonadota bacterium]
MSRQSGLRVAGTGLALACLLGMAVALPRPASPPVEAWAAPDLDVTDEAIGWFETKLAADPTNPLLAAHLTSRYMGRFGLSADLDDVRGAERLARALIPLSRDKARAWTRLSEVLLARHAFGDALTAARRAVAADSADADAWGALYDAGYAAGSYAEAEVALTRLEPGVARRVREAFWLSAGGESDRAAARLGEACRTIAGWNGRETTVAWCLTELGHLELARKGPSAAETVYVAALEAFPGYRAAVEGLADLAHARGDWPEAERLYRRIAVDAHPDLYLRLAETRRMQGDPAGAAAWDRKFLRVASERGAEPLYAHPLALYYAEREETRALALAVALRDVRRRPTVESWDVLAWVRFRRGDLVEALAASDRALAWGSPSPTMEYRRARILASLGRRGEAAPLLERALEEPALLEPGARIEGGTPIAFGIGIDQRR